MKDAGLGELEQAVLLGILAQGSESLGTAPPGPPSNLMRSDYAFRPLQGCV